MRDVRKRRSGYGDKMISKRQRTDALIRAAACLVMVGVIGLMVTRDRSPFDSFDRWGRLGEDWADDHLTLVQVLRVVEVSFATIGMIVLVTVLSAVLLVRRRVTATIFAVLVMVTTSLTTTALKLALARVVRTGRTTRISSRQSRFPPDTRHRRRIRWHPAPPDMGSPARPTRRWPATGGVVVVWLVVCLDRVLLGRHFPSDVLAGSLLGVAVVLIGVAILGSRTPAKAEEAELPPGSRAGT